MEILWAPFSLITFCPIEFPYDQSYGNSVELKKLLSAHMDNIWTLMCGHPISVPYKAWGKQTCQRYRISMGILSP